MQQSCSCVLKLCMKAQQSAIHTGRQAGASDLSPVKDGGTKAGLQAELMPMLLSDVSIQLGEQVAGVHDRGGYGQARRALEFLAPGAACLGQQPTHPHAHMYTLAGPHYRRRHVLHLQVGSKWANGACSQRECNSTAHLVKCQEWCVHCQSMSRVTYC